jgi:mannose-6-phosphate isomerase-like protein (cupin superfamily)
MRTVNVRLALTILALSCASGSALSQVPPDADAQYLSAAQLRALVPAGGAVAAKIPTGPGAAVAIVRHDGVGVVELHTKANVEIVAYEGQATVVVGGRVDGDHEASPGEWRGGTIVGGRSYDMAPGDVLWLPAAEPHQVTVPPGGSFVYLAFKYAAEEPIAAKQ